MLHSHIISFTPSKMLIKHVSIMCLYVTVNPKSCTYNVQQTALIGFRVCIHCEVFNYHG